MLFDTHSPRRRRAVQVTFALLALLMGGGLVLFGIGSNQQGGGLADIAGNGQVDLVGEAEKSAEQAQKALVANPKDEAAASKLALARFTIAANKAYDPKTGKLTDDGQSLLDQADASWTAYLKLGPAKPDPKTAFNFVSFYTSQGSVDYAKATRALEAVLVTRDPSAGLYAQLAVYAIASGDNSKYEAARKRALSLATSDERRTSIAKELDDIEKQVADAIKAQQKAAEASGESTDGTTPPLKTLPNLGGVSSGGGLGG